jgi:hypothetical protein
MSWKMTMPETAEPRWPKEAHPWRDEAQAYRRRVSERALAWLERATWRARAVSQASDVLERKLGAEPASVDKQFDFEPIALALRQANLSGAPDAGASATEQADSNNLILGALVGEAAAVLLHRKTTHNVWSVAHGLWFNFDGAFVSFRTRLRTDLLSDRSFRERFDILADKVVDQAIANPADRMIEREHGSFLALLETWRRAPDLRSVWLGLPQMRHVHLFSEVDSLVNIYFTVDAARAVELLSRFDNPYQIWAVLSGIGGLGLDRNFAAWADFLRHAPPSFVDDGSWTGRTLEPLLLVIAQQALSEARVPEDTGADVMTVREGELRSLTTAITALIAEKPQGAALALRWGGWLFRFSSSALDHEGQQYPRDLRQRSTPFWRMLETLARSEAAKSWNAIPVADAASDEVLCLLCSKILAANENNFALPDREPLWRCIPAAPEDFLGEQGCATRNLTSLFSTFGARPDGLKFRMLSFLFLAGDPVALYRQFWRRTLTLRELAEHWQSGEPNDGRIDAKRVLGMVLAVGLSLVDCYAVASLPNDVDTHDRSIHFGELFGLVYDGLREIQAIELFDQTFWSTLYMHLLIRRALYENARAGDVVITAPLGPDVQPTLASMLANVAGVTPAFFQGLDGLTRNGVSVDRVTAALSEGGINLPMLVDSARRLNEIDPRQPLQIEAAARVVDQLSPL